MSWDYSVFYTSRPLSDKHAMARHNALCERGEDNDILSYIEPHPSVASFIAELISIYPAPDGDDPLACTDTWSYPLDISEGHIIMSVPMNDSIIDAVTNTVTKLTQKYGLVYFDPQDGVIIQAPEGIRLEASPWWKFW